MFRVTPIGSCRVTGPLLRGQDIHGYALNRTRCYGYCHSSGEAVQFARFLKGQFAPDPELWPLISKSHSLADICEAIHTPSNVYVIEISSAKRITIDGTFVQLNYLTDYLRRALDTHDALPDFWTAVTTDNQGQIDAFLDKHCIDQVDRKLLRRVRLSTTTKTQLCEDISTLQALLPNTLFVTHVNARKLDGLPITSRAAFIDMVKDAVRACGARVYDPTRHMIELGQNLAIADESEGLAHFTDAFADRIVSDWVRSTIAPAMKDAIAASGSAGLHEILAPRASAMIRQGQFKELEDGLTALTFARPNCVALASLQQEVTVKKKQAQARLKQLNRDAKTSPRDQEMQYKRAVLATQLLQADDFVSAMTALAQADALPPPHVILQMVQSVRVARKPEQLISVLSLTITRNPDNGVVAQTLTDVLLDAAPAHLAIVPNSVQTILAKHIDPVDLLRLCDCGGWGSLVSCDALCADGIEKVAAYLTNQGNALAAARACRTWIDAQAKQPRASVMFQAVIDRWIETATTEAHLPTQIKLLNAVLAVDPRHKSGRYALRDCRTMLRAQMRDAIANHDGRALDALVTANCALPAPIKELDLHRARSRFDSEDYAGAANIALEVVQVMPDNLSAWVLLLRAAVKQKDLLAVDNYAQRVLALCPDTTHRLAKEAQTRRTANADACAQSADTQPEPELAEKLRAIAADQLGAIVA